MKILQVINSLDTGGAQTLVEFLLSRDTLNSHKVVVLLSRGNISNRVEALAQVEYLNLSKNPLSIFVAIRKIRRLAIEHQTQLIHSHLFQSDIAALAVAKAIRVPIVTTVHTTGFSSEDSFQSRFLAKIMPFLSRSYDMIVACSRSSLEYMKRHAYSLDKTSLIFNSTEFNSKSTIEADSREVLCLSRFHPMKDHETLLRAWKLVTEVLPDARLRLAGTGVDSKNQTLACLIEELGLSKNVFLCGASENVASLLSRAKILVISSRWGEALPMAGLEALASGRPVISTNVGDCHLLTIKPDMLVEPADFIGLAKSIIHHLQMSGTEYQKLSEKSREQFTTMFSPDRTLIGYQSIYSNLGSKN